MDPFEKFEQNLQHDQVLRTQLEERLKHIDSLEGNEAALKEELKKMGVDDLSAVNIDIDKLTNISESLKKKAESAGIIVLNPKNPKSTGLNNFLTKIIKQGSISEIDRYTLLHLANTYYEEEQKIKAARCFHPEQQLCKGGIISAHSVQSKGPLQRIAIHENNKFEVIHFKRNLINYKWQAESIITKHASTFKGFCKHHDDLFADNIEKVSYQGTNKQNFLHSYRSFAYSYHKKLEHYTPIEFDGLADLMSDLLGECSDLLSMFGALKPGAIIPSVNGMRISEENRASRNADQFEDHKLELNNMIQQERYDGLEYITFELEHICPIVCASIVKMHAETDDYFVIENKGKIYNGSPIILTIVHTPLNTSLILLARFKSDVATEIIFRQLSAMSPTELEQRVTTLIFEQVENFYLAPSFWRYLPQMEKEKITNDLDRKKEQFPYKSTFEASINIFDRIHTIS